VMSWKRRDPRAPLIFLRGVSDQWRHDDGTEPWIGNGNTLMMTGPCAPAGAIGEPSRRCLRRAGSGAKTAMIDAAPALIKSERAAFSWYAQG
jgi:hypothetical protein